MTPGGTAWPRAAVVGVALVVVAFLVWRVVATGSHAMSERNPLGALQVDGARNDARAAESALRKRLASNPADATALVAIALELERQGRHDEAGEAMRAGMRLAPGDPPLLLVAADYYLRNGDERQALAILRRAVDASPWDVAERVWPVFAAALDTGRHLPFFDNLARGNPPWWPAFVRFACQRATDVGALGALYSSRAATKVATADEWRCLVDRLQKGGRWQDAYQVWLNGLPLEQRQRVGFVFNGGFEVPLSNVGFDWRVPAQEGAVVSAEPSTGMTDARALTVSFANRRYAGPPIYQYLMLFPGRYRLEGRSRSTLDAWLGLQWGVYCQEEGRRETRQLARTDSISGTTSWKDFRQEFAVPADCPVQLLRLELAPPRNKAGSVENVAIRLKGTAWFDELRVRQVD